MVEFMTVSSLQRGSCLLISTDLRQHTFSALLCADPDRVWPQEMCLKSYDSFSGCHRKTGLRDLQLCFHLLIIWIFSFSFFPALPFSSHPLERQKKLFATKNILYMGRGIWMGKVGLNLAGGNVLFVTSGHT